METITNFASQLSQELSNRDSQISKLAAENSRLRALEGENARLRALLEAVAASNNSNPATTTDIPSVESQPRVLTAEDRQQTEDALLDEAYDVTEAEGAKSPQLVGGASGRLNNNRTWMGSSFHRQSLSSDDDEDPIPMPKKEKAPFTTAAKDAAPRTSSMAAAAWVAKKRKRAPESSFSTSLRLSESLSGLAVDESRARVQSLPSFNHPASQESEARPAKKPRGHRGPIHPPSKAPGTAVQTPARKKTRPPHPYTPLGKSPFQAFRHHATPPPPPRKRQLPSTFRFPGSSSSSGGSNDNSNDNNTTRPSQPIWPKKRNQRKLPSHTTGQHKPTNPSKPTSTATYTEVEPFTFKFIASYSNSPNSSQGETLEISLHDSASLAGTMSSFWKTLTALRDKWEDQAGADWTWEVQKKVKARGRGGRHAGIATFKRFCVSSKLANRPTKWRPGDSGFYACLECAGAAKPCFTWVRDESGESGNGDDESGAPPGDFWCLPVHPEDRRCVDLIGREIRTWVNEG